MNHEGNLVITAENAKNYATLTSVDGYLYLRKGAKLEAPALTSVDGYLYLREGAHLDAPALTSVAKYLHLYAGATLDAPALYPPGFAAFRVVDGIATVELSRRRVGGVEVARCRYAKIRDQKLVGDVVYIAYGEDGSTAHGKTAREALAELRFKSSGRDISQLRDLPLSTRKAVDDWVFAYRVVTGACAEGCRHFLAGQGKLPKSLTLAQVIERTKGKYGAEEFARICGGAK